MLRRTNTGLIDIENPSFKRIAAKFLAETQDLGGLHFGVKLGDLLFLRTEYEVQTPHTSKTVLGPKF